MQAPIHTLASVDTVEQWQERAERWTPDRGQRCKVAFTALRMPSSP